MEEKKGPLGGLIKDAVLSMNNDPDSQKPVNIQASPESIKKERSANAMKSVDFDNFNKVNSDNKKDIGSVKMLGNLASDKYVKWFSELSNDDIGVAGGKGASLGEMYNNKFPVPLGFVVTAQAFDYFITSTGIKEEIANILDVVDVDNTEELTKVSKKVRKIIEAQKFPDEMHDEIIEAYHILSSEKIDERGVSQDALTILRNSKEPLFVSVRSSATTEDLSDASFAGQQESFLNIKGDRKLIEHVKKCFSSLYTPRAIYYRDKKGFKEEALIAVIVQKMVDSEKSGVIFSKDPIKLDDSIAIEAVYGLGEGIVGGKIQPDCYNVSRNLEINNIKVGNKKIAVVRTSGGENEIVKLSPEKSKSQVLTNGQILEAADYAVKLEEHYQKPQDIEFAVEGGKIFILQSRPITTLERKKQEKVISGNVLLEGLGSSPGIGVGVVRIIKNLEDLSKIKKGDILVTEMTNPDMVVSMQKSIAIVTDEGGMTAHASIVSREMGIPAVVGTGKATRILKDGMKITVDGYNGKIYEGEVAETETAEIKRAVETERVRLKVILDLPSFAERAAESGIIAVGLMRLEGIIASSGKHPLVYEKQGNLTDYTELLRKGIEEIAKKFESIWIRSSDIRTDEFSSLEGAPEREINPMLGFHGIRFSLKHPEILKAELNAVKLVAEKYPNKKLGVMFPQVISIEEVREAKKYFNDVRVKNMEFGVMIETPAAVQIIEDICEEVDFVSLGTNDLAQYTLAVDRGEDEVQYLYNELHPAIFSQIRKVIGICRSKRVETSICGQAGSKKEMVDFLFKKGIDSISVNADAASEISQYIKELEKEWNRLREEREQEKQRLQEERKREEENTVNAQQSQQDGQVRDTGQDMQNTVNDVREINSGVRESSPSSSDLRDNSRNKDNRWKKKKWDRRKFKRFKKHWNKKAQSLPELEREPEQKEKPVDVSLDTYEQRQKQRLLDESKIQIPAEVEEKTAETIEQTSEYQENVGPIKPFGDTSRIDEKAEEIQEKVEQQNKEDLQKFKKWEDKIEVSGGETSEEERKVGDLQQKAEKDKAEAQAEELLQDIESSGSSEEKTSSLDKQNINNIKEKEEPLSENLEETTSSDADFDNEDIGIYNLKDKEEKKEYKYFNDDW